MSTFVSSGIETAKDKNFPIGQPQLPPIFVDDELFPVFKKPPAHTKKATNIFSIPRPPEKIQSRDNNKPQFGNNQVFNPDIYSFIQSKKQAYDAKNMALNASHRDPKSSNTQTQFKPPNSDSSESIKTKVYSKTPQVVSKPKVYSAGTPKNPKPPSVDNILKKRSSNNTLNNEKPNMSNRSANLKKINTICLTDHPSVLNPDKNKNSNLVCSIPTEHSLDSSLNSDMDTNLSVKNNNYFSSSDVLYVAKNKAKFTSKGSSTEISASQEFDEILKKSYSSNIAEDANDIIPSTVSESSEVRKDLEGHSLIKNKSFFDKKYKSFVSNDSFEPKEYNLSFFNNLPNSKPDQVSSENSTFLSSTLESQDSNSPLSSSNDHPIHLDHEITIPTSEKEINKTDQNTSNQTAYRNSKNLNDSSDNKKSRSEPFITDQLPGNGKSQNTHSILSKYSDQQIDDLGVVEYTPKSEQREAGADAPIQVQRGLFNSGNNNREASEFTHQNRSYSPNSSNLPGENINSSIFVLSKQKNYIRIKVQRDYAYGDCCQFYTQVPEGIIEKIDNQKFIEFIRTLNEMLVEAEGSALLNFFEGLLTCVTLYIYLLVSKSHYQKVYTNYTQQLYYFFSLPTFVFYLFTVPIIIATTTSFPLN
ncbi:hypothetical protein BB560_000407 [Smittium megazygosporum]|uniref:Ras modification protein ERF4 n=1 Tax=Smittium megazygosporum TaxID=133381 RepID=A0A2T9ZKF1_9FUNG|nr:hypothetical protein BB560_000407 [Smittium megazygosporum]